VTPSVATLQASAGGKAVRFQGPGSPTSDRGGEEGGTGSPVAAGSPTLAGSPVAVGGQQSRQLGPEGRRALDVLFDGLAAEFHGMVRQLIDCIAVGQP
jgi:hypothetical protein